MKVLYFEKVENVDIGQQCSYEDFRSDEINHIRQIRVSKDKIELFFYDRTGSETIDIKSLDRPVVIYSSAELSNILDF